MELVGKGAFAPGAVWVATRVPDGAILAHANQARTTTFMKNTATAIGPEGDVVEVAAETLYSRDVVDFARSIGRYPAVRVAFADEDVDFSAAYDPITFSGARHGEARAWDIYRPSSRQTRWSPTRVRAGSTRAGCRCSRTRSGANKPLRRVTERPRRHGPDAFSAGGLLVRPARAHPAGLGAGPGHSAYRCGLSSGRTLAAASRAPRSSRTSARW